MSALPLPRNIRGSEGRNFPAIAARKLRAEPMSKLDFTSHDYVSGIATALRVDYGDNSSMVKTICEDTGASVGAVKNWLAEINGPGGEHLIKLMAASPAVRAFVDRITRRDDIAKQAEDRMRRALAIMEGREDP